MLFMELTTTITPVLGILIGILMGLTGAGGGILSVPTLIFFLGLNISEAAPIALMAIASSAGIGALLAHRAKTLRYKAASLMAICGLMFAPAGLYLAFKLPNEPLSILFGIVLLIVAIRSYLQAHQELTSTKPKLNTNPPCCVNPNTGKFIWSGPCLRTMLLIGSVAGFLSGLLGVGGGFVIVPALRKYTDLNHTSVISTSLGVMSIIAMGSVGMSAYAGTLLWPIAILFSLGAIIGLLIGRRFNNYLNPGRSHQAFAVFTFLVALYMLIKAFLNL
jgi:uncharacterized membrane protein YfcA